MDIRKVLFIGRGYNRAASVQIRCVDIAQQLGCDYSLGVKHARDVPQKYAAFICVKSELPAEELSILAKRGIVIWDIVDYVPPKENIAIYLVSNLRAQKLFANYGRIELIHHHHCNFEGTANPADLRRPTWIGSREWFPAIHGFEYDYYDVASKTQEEVVAILRKTGIGLSLRIARNKFRRPGVKYTQQAKPVPNQTQDHKADRRLFDYHLAVTSGIKLINCIGFGIPSISSDEPAYREIGEDCTIFSNIKNCAKWVCALQHDNDLYMDLRKKCLRKADAFHIDTIAEKYKELFRSL